MCFYIDIKRNPNNKPKIATEDIVCYKTLRTTGKKNVYISVYRSYEYNFNKQKTYKVSRFSKRVTFSGVTSIERGFHSYSAREQARIHKDSYLNEHIVKFVIPKGTKYFYNPSDKEYCSLAIKYVGRVI